MLQCKECRELLPQYLMDELDQDVSRSVRSHLDSGCLQCRAELAELAEAIGQLTAGSVEHPAPSVDREQVWANINGRIEEPVLNPPIQPVAQKATSAGTGRGLNLFTAIICSLAAGFLVMSVIRMASDPHSDVFGYNFFRNDRDQIASRGDADGGPGQSEIGNLQTVALHRVDDPKRQCGTIVFDAYESQIHVFLSGLPALTAGQTYMFWFRDSNGQWLSPTRLQTRRGVVKQVIDVPPHHTPLTFAITIEGEADDDKSKSRVAVITGDRAIDDGTDA
ncbi:zf-HC2 domain-containing protein [Stieleria sp.]|uniref:zf-HC2 domain-containing protein n=1 Tax=Stieleria sp. TaxID=2795976 RepID=UPI003569656A